MSVYDGLMYSQLSPAQQKTYRLITLEKHINGNQRIINGYENYLKRFPKSDIKVFLGKEIKALKEEVKKLIAEIDEEFKEKVTFT